MNTGTGPDVLHVVHTGQAIADLHLVQEGASASLGGYGSGTRAQSYSVLRPSAVPGFVVEYVSGLNGAGLARIEINDAGEFRYAAPGEDFGAYQTVAVDARGVLPSETDGKYAIIVRTGTVVRAVESIQLRPTVNNVVGTSDFEEAESTAGGEHYRAVMFRNASDATIDSVKVWVSASDIGDVTPIGPDTAWSTANYVASAAVWTPLQATGDDYWHLTDADEATFAVTDIPTGTDLDVALELGLRSLVAYDLANPPIIGSTVSGTVALTGTAVLRIYGLPIGDKDGLAFGSYVFLEQFDSSGDFAYTFTSSGYGAIAFQAAATDVGVPIDESEEAILLAAGAVITGVTYDGLGTSIEIGEDTIDGEGAAQTVATEADAPLSVTFSAPLDIDAALELGPLTAGSGVPLWIKRSVPTGATANAASSASIIYDADGLSGTVLGVNRVAEADIANYVLLAALGADPDPDTDIVAESATLPVTYEAELGEGEWHVETRRRNRFGLLSAAIRTDIIQVDAEGAVVENPPSEPTLINVQRSTTAGAVAVSASYFPAADEMIATGLRATHWAIWVAEGVDPDPTDPETAEIQMSSATGSSVERLLWISDTFADETNVRVLVRSRRKVEVPDVDPEEPSTYVDTDSTNTTILQVTATSVGPERPRGDAFLGRDLGVAAPAIETTITYVDEGNNIRFESGADFTIFYADDVLIWGVVHSGPGFAPSTMFIPSMELIGDAVSGTNPAGITVDPAWPTTKKIYISAGTDDNPTAENIVVIDIDAMTITAAEWSASPVTAGASTDAWKAEADRTSFYVTNPLTDTKIAYATALDTGVFNIGVQVSNG